MTIPSALFMRQNLTLRRSSNFEGATARNRALLNVALANLEAHVDDPSSEARIGQKSRFDQFEAAMVY